MTMALLAMPALGSLLGGLLVEFVTISRRALSLALHGVAGILLGVVGVELMPMILEAGDGWIYASLFMAGALFTLGIDWATNLTRRLMQEAAPETGQRPRAGDEPDAARAAEPVAKDKQNAWYLCRRPIKHEWAAKKSGGAAAWVIFFGVAIDFITDGLLLVSGAEVSEDIGLLLGIALVASDTPEAFATIANMRESGSTRRARVLLSLSFPVVLIAGGLLGEWLLRGAPMIVQFGVIAFTAGIILTLVESQIIPETFETWEGKTATLVLVGSFIGFALLSTWLA